MAALLYKQYPTARTVFCLLFFAVLAGFPWSVRAETNPVYTVEGVEVDVTAENAVKAREKALNEAQLKAYQMLAERLLGPEDLKTFRMPDADSVSLLVQDFEVTNEQLSRVRYKGTYTIRFRPNAMRSQISAQGRSYSDQMQKPVLVLPFYQAGHDAVLWNDGNPWMAAWRSLPASPASLQPVAVPLGDASDMALIGEGQFTNYDPMEMQQLASRYGADDVAILLAVDNRAAPRKLGIHLYKHGFEGPTLVRKIAIAAGQGETDAALFARAAAQVKAVLRQGWKNDAPYAAPLPQDVRPQVAVAQPGGAPPLPYTRQAAGPATTFNVHARFASVQEWVRLKGALDRTQGVQSVLVKALRPREATLDIRFAGTINQLQAALQPSGIMMRASSASAPIELYMPTVFTNPYRTQ